jgi:hypothetical protein
VDCQARVMVGEERVVRWARAGGGGGGGEGVACGVVEVILDGGRAGGVGRLEVRSGERDKKGRSIMSDSEFKRMRELKRGVSG